MFSASKAKLLGMIMLYEQAGRDGRVSSVSPKPYSYSQASIDTNLI